MTFRSAQSVSSPLVLLSPPAVSSHSSVSGCFSSPTSFGSSAVGMSNNSHHFPFVSSASSFSFAPSSSTSATPATSTASAPSLLSSFGATSLTGPASSTGSFAFSSSSPNGAAISSFASLAAPASSTTSPSLQPSAAAFSSRGWSTSPAASQFLSSSSSSSFATAPQLWSSSSASPGGESSGATLLGRRRPRAELELDDHDERGDARSSARPNLRTACEPDAFATSSSSTASSSAAQQFALGKRKQAPSQLATLTDSALAFADRHLSQHSSVTLPYEQQAESVLGKRRHNDELLAPSSMRANKRGNFATAHRMDPDSMAMVVYRSPGSAATAADASLTAFQSSSSSSSCGDALQKNHTTPLLLMAPPTRELGKRGHLDRVSELERRCRQRRMVPGATLQQPLTTTDGLIPLMHATPGHLPASLENTAYLSPFHVSQQMTDSVLPLGALSLHSSSSTTSSMHCDSAPDSYFSIEELDQDGDDIIQDVSDPDDDLEQQQCQSPPSPAPTPTLTPSPFFTGGLLSQQPFSQWGGE
eukprot:CAMPEP_0177670296 /NCGR_PEP_ID=MMETSP0447-20121125/23999_1 /TAXON_ID=0 /ORGANISM="Stygamoeba regulata, Strain BSH-02190019" /LENGTH=531 /DNA_ID=CAMNT_0019177421 /DNA_START=173 /DNA_END=1768 /DNA_ORIENTATION=-